MTPPPVGAPPGAPTHKFLCYKVKCPRALPTATLQDQFGTHQVQVKKTSLLCAPVPVLATTTTTVLTTTTTTLQCTDADMDGYCAQVACNDMNPNINPGELDFCDGTDDDCSGVDGDDNVGGAWGVGQCQSVYTCQSGMLVCNGAAPSQEVCLSGVDEDCDGMTDEPPCVCLSAGNCPAVPNGQAACTAFQCTFTCNPGFADCKAQAVDGCEVSTTNDPNNCGGCNLVCPLVAPNCVASACTP